MPTRPRPPRWYRRRDAFDRDNAIRLVRLRPADNAKPSDEHRLIKAETRETACTTRKAES
jgi:hypothetical protein